MSSYDHFPHIPRTRDGSPNWAADTDPVGPVTPELALVDPDLARGDIYDDEVTMSSMQFGEPQGPVEGQPPVPLQPLVVAPAAPEAPPPAPVPMEPVAAPAEPAPAVPVNDMRDVPLGTLVFRAGLLPEEQLEEALQEGMKTGKRLGEVLLERGLVSETDLGRLLAAQKGLPFVELDPSALDPTAPPLLPAEKARLHGALPIGFEGGVPVVAVADPTNDLVIENVRRALACEPVLVVAGRDALMNAIDYAYDNAYDNSAPAQPAPEPQPVAVEPLVATPVVEPLAPPVVEPVVAPVVEPMAAPVVQPPAVPVVEPQPAPVVAAEPVVPAQPAPNGDGIWLGQPLEAQAPQVAPAEPVPPAPEPIPVAPVVQAPVEPFVAPGPEPEPVVEPAAVVEPTPDPVEELTWSVVLRLADGDRIEVGCFPGEEAAVEGARAVVAQIAAEGSWPFFAGRFIRPEGIVSVDLVELEVSKWLGSSVRAAALPHEQHPTT